MFVGGWLSLGAVLSNIIATGDAKFASVLGAVLVICEGGSMVQAVENELDSEAAADS